MDGFPTNTLRYMLTPSGYRIMARNLRRDGYNDQEVVAAMTKRLNLDRFDYDALDEVDKRRHEALRDFLEELANHPQSND